MRASHLAALAGAAALAATAAFAQQPGRGPGQGPVMSQCKEDIAKFCAGKEHGGDVRACLAAKTADVSAACKSALETTAGKQGKGQGMGQGMGHGKGAGMGPGQGMGPGKGMGEGMGQGKGMGHGKGMSHGAGKGTPGSGPVAAQCNDDIAKFCADKSHGGGDVRACLTAKKADVSPACKTALETTGPGSGAGKTK